MSYDFTIAVIICTHNPRMDCLNRVLSALKLQSFPLDKWELLVVDNASDRILKDVVDLEWHPNARHLREERLGKIYALMTGFRESQSELIITFDDDTIPAGDYLEKAVTISSNWSRLGAWGGQVNLEFDGAIPEWTREYWWCFGDRHFNTDHWANLHYLNESTPCGGGMCLRRCVALKYMEETKRDPLRQTLGRFGKGVGGSEDSDLALVSCDLGLGTGTFAGLCVTHIVQASRVQEPYLLKLYEGIAYSGLILKALRNQLPKTRRLRARLLDRLIALGKPARTRRFMAAASRGEARALHIIKEGLAKQPSGHSDGPE
jgi:glycosyltransferase involved in cell wall biosynthesis